MNELDAVTWNGSAWQIGDLTAGALAQKLAGESAPLELVPGLTAPHAAGERGYYTTLSGKTIVRHPRAYGWGVRYHPSTRRLEVGAGWLVHEARRGGWAERDDTAGTSYVQLSSTRMLHGYRVERAWYCQRVVTRVSDLRRWPDSVWVYHSFELDPRAALRDAIQARRKQVRADRAAAREAREREKHARVLVTLDDSVAAGNCAAGSQAFAELALIRLRSSGWRGLTRLKALRGDTLLRLRDDQYTRRAVATAARRQAHQALSLVAASW